MGTYIRALVTASTLAITALPVAATDLDAGDYDGLPTGMNLGVLYLQHAQRDALYAADQKVPGRNGLDSQLGILRMGRTMEYKGIPFVPQFLLPFGQIQGKDDQDALGQTRGVGDLILAMPTWFYRDFENHVYFGLTNFLFLPTGKYHRNAALNLGENRLKYDLQIGFSAPLFTKSLRWDIAADAIFYGDNNRAGQQRLEQDTGWQLQSSLRYVIRPTLDLRAGVIHTDAGDTRLDGVEADGMVQTKAWAGTGVFLTSTLQLVAVYGRDINVENGFKEAHRVNLRFFKAL